MGTRIQAFPHAMTLDLQAKSFSLANALTLAGYAKRAYSEATISDPSTDTQVLVCDLGDCVVVAFRGTSSIRDFITDAKAWRTFTLMGEVHHGFWDAWRAIAKQLWQNLMMFGFKPVIMTGHSLGGSLAMIAARALRNNMVKVHSVYTFGAPRVGDKEFQTGYNTQTVPGSPFDTLGDATFTLINDCDIVPRIPGWLGGYRRPGRDEFISFRGKIIQDPTVFTRLFSDALSLWMGWEARRNPTFVEELLTDHHVDNYINDLEKLALEVAA